jgi:hypothetical protein
VRSAIEDAEAVARACDGDLDAYGVLVARYTLRAHRAAFLLGAGEESDDVVQEAFVKAFRHLSSGRVVSLIYRRTPYGLVRMDEFAGYVDQIYFEKLAYVSDATQVRVNGTEGLWIKGPHDLMYITRDGAPADASARLTTGNTLIWSTRQVALRLEGNLSQTAALAIADSAR